MRRVVLLGVASVVWATTALAYWAPNHQQLNEQIFCSGKPWGEAGFKRTKESVKGVIDYARRVLYLSDPGTCTGDETERSGGAGLRGVEFRDGYDQPGDNPSTGMSLLDWNKNGGLWEDGFKGMDDATKWGGRRAVNHFHDPLTTEGGYTGITSEEGDPNVPYRNLLRRGISATRWAMNEGGNRWGYPTVGDCFHRAFTELKDERREAGIACAFRALGHVEHLVEDNTVPDHARDLAHPGDGWEEYLQRSRPELFKDLRVPWIRLPLKVVEAGGLRAIWDRDRYNGANPETTRLNPADPVGISEFTNANFYAWNIFTKLGSTVFTTIPDEPGQGFKRGWRVQAGPTEVPFPFPLPFGIRTNSVEYPYPQWVDSPDPIKWPDLRTIHVPITEVPSAKKPRLNAEVWAPWAEPLLARALGYGQTTVSLALQPARAEVVASPDGDPLKLKVRLWNLWPSESPDAVTWNIDELQLVGVRAQKQPLTAYADEGPISIPAGLHIGPGQMAETELVTLTWAQRGPLAIDSHTALLVKAHLGQSGSGGTTTPVVFVVVMPNALVWVKQTSGVDLTPPFVSALPGGVACTTSECNFDGESGIYRNPTRERVTGRIELAAAEVDAVGRPADDLLKQVQRQDARIAGVALVAMSRGTGLELVHPERSTLTLSGSSLVSVGKGVFVRPEDAPDEADSDTGLEFTAELDLDDFYHADIGNPTQDAMRSWGNIYIAVWTTAGAVQLQRLALWPRHFKETAAAHVASMLCDVRVVPHGLFMTESRGVCSYGGRGSPCGSHQFVSAREEMMWADIGAPFLGLRSALDLASSVWLLGGTSELRPTRLAGRDIPLSGEAQMVEACSETQLSGMTGDSDMLCALGGELIFYTAKHASGSGTCSTPAPPRASRTAEYKRIFRPDFRDVVKRSFGVSTPEEWTFTLSSAQ